MNLQIRENFVQDVLLIISRKNFCIQLENLGWLKLKIGPKTLLISAWNLFGETIGYKDLENFREVVLQDVLKMFSEKGSVKLVKLPSKKRINKIAVSSTIDLESDNFIFEIIEGNLKELDRIKAVDKNIIKPLYLFLDKEVLLYAKLKRLKYKKEKIKRNKFSDFVNGLEKKHPEVKRAIFFDFIDFS